ncbi:MAG: tetratricopeptide repeat protein [Pyrinomonadaceae bacterium]
MFDKSKAMRSAERFLSQGKIREAIEAYREVVENDPRDMVTLNMLGDLYAKGSDSFSAVKCYRAVAEHYSNQGFAQKAIAIYNKISRLQPNSPEVTQKLAELYKIKGSLKEAKSHYSTLAEHYSKQGRRVEALEIWTEVAILDPNNTEVYLTIADAFLQEERLDEAADAFANAGARFAAFSRHEDAIAAFSKAFGIDPKHPKAMRGFLDANLALGRNAEVIDHIEGLIIEQPGNRDLLAFLIDAHIRTDNVVEAENALNRLLEAEPTNYLKALDIAEMHISKGDIDSAMRNLTIASEHMIVGGQAPDLQTRLERVETIEPGRLDVVRLLARFCVWQKDDEYLRNTLKRLAEIAKAEGSIDDERFALSQLVVAMPQDAKYRARLREIHQELGISEDVETESVFDKRFVREKLDVNGSNGDVAAAVIESDEFAIVGIVTDVEAEQHSNESFKTSERETSAERPEPALPTVSGEAGSTDSLQTEIDSIKFYIENGYTDLAVKAIEELKSKFGERPEISELVLLMSSPAAVEFIEPEIEVVEDEPTITVAFDLDDFRSELGLIDGETAIDNDFETPYQTAVAYQEMGLLEQAIKEFQDAADLVSPNDGTRRFFNCANLLGHCFMELGKPNLAVKWHLRSLESYDISDEERRGVWYELGVAYEADGDAVNAAKYFEQVYSENIDFRDIGERMKNLAVAI